MNLLSFFKIAVKRTWIPLLILILALLIESCSTFKYRTYTIIDTTVEDPEPNYELTLNPAFQEYTSYMFLGNRIENFGTYFNTYFNAEENFDNGYDIYVTQVLTNYSNSIDSVYINPRLSQEGIDDFNKAIEKASKVIQYHKSSAFMDQAVLLIGESYYYLGDYLKAERKFSEFISKLSSSPLLDEALLFYARTELRMKDYTDALNRIDNLIKNTKDQSIVAGAYQSLAEYYISIRDYESAVTNYQKSIQFSKDSQFKAQMQFLIATLVARNDPAKGSAEYNKVLDYNTTFDLEYLSKFNSLKYLILSNNFTNVADLLDKLKVKYKDNPAYLSDIELLDARYYQQKKDYKKAVSSYRNVIMNYARTPASSDACCALGKYYENDLGDYLTAYKYYKLSVDESNAGRDYNQAAARMNILKTYFDLRSIIIGSAINIDNDTTFINYQRDSKNKQQNPEQKEQGKDRGKGEGGRPGGDPIFPDSIKGGELDSQGNIKAPKDTLKMKKDTLKQTQAPVDSTRIKEENIAKAKFELAELFIYSLRKQDSAVHYLNEAYEQSGDYDFKAKVLFALASLYKSSGDEANSTKVLEKIITEYPTSPVVNSSKRILNLPVEDESVMKETVDSIYLDAENKFNGKQYSPALDEFKNIIANYASSKYYARSNYAAGWIFENVLNKPDSAYFYYSNIIQLAPKSPLVQLVSGKILEYQNFIAMKNDTSKTKTDSLQSKNDTLQLKNDTLQVVDSSGMKEQEIKKEGTKNPENGTDVTGPTNPSGTLPDINKNGQPGEEPTKKP
jgi:tetratricopeptide (TPR) repeat protein